MPFWIRKIIHFEFWPYWILYLPVFFYYLFLALKARSFSFFTAANPGIFLGGFTQASKYAILSQIDQQYVPKTLLIEGDLSSDKALDLLRQCHFRFPLILKPDIGERGKGVERVDTEPDVVAYLNQAKGATIVQEFITHPIELGVLFYKTPDGREKGITSIVVKEFLTITGNGQLTIQEWIHTTERAQLQRGYLLQKYHHRLEEVLPSGHQLVLEPIGNHCRGTVFRDGRQLINTQLVDVFDRIASTIDGFYVGRFDLKVKSIDDLYRGEHISILELNGVASEPAHIYDPQTSLSKAYAALFHQYRLFYTIARQNKQLGVQYIPFQQLFNAVRLHYRSA